MTFLRKFVLASDSLFYAKKWVTSCQNNWNVQHVFFGSKVELPSPPKRPLTAYMIFCKENRKLLLKENPALSSPEQIKILAEKWSHLTEDMKRPYEISARENTLLYGEAHKKFYESLTEEQKDELVRLKSIKKEARRTMRLKKALRESGIPKPAGTAYTFFVQSQAKHMGHIRPPSTFIKEVSTIWKNLSENEKKIFEDQAQKDKERYAKEFTEWKEKLHKENKDDILKAYEELRRKGKSIVSDDVEHIAPKMKKNVKIKIDDSKN